MLSPRVFATAMATAGLLAPPASAEWTNRYSKVAGVSHHVYLEGFNLPTFSSSPTDPAPSPDGRSIAVAARGWLWVMDTATRRAKRLTRGGGNDSRPAWSPDGRRIAFVRDNMRDTAIWLVDVANGTERALVDSPAIDLDPAFESDGRAVLYSSAEAGDLDIWRVDVATGAKTRLTKARGQELNPQAVAGGVLHVAKVSGAMDTVAIVAPDGTTTTLRNEGLAPQLRVAAAPDGRSFAMTPMNGDRTALLLSRVRGGETIRIASDAAYPLSPAWGRDGHLWYVEPGRDERFRLFRIAVTGGAPEDQTPLAWDMGQPTARVTIRTARGAAPLAARLTVTDRDGHFAAPDTGISHFDGQNGRVFFHSPGTVTLTVPAGSVTVAASHGFDGTATITRQLRAGEDATIDLDIPAPGLDLAARGWYSGDLHSHLNYGGPYQLEPEDMVTALRAEAVDVSTPQLANLHTNRIDTRWWGWQRTEPPLIRFSQEVRAHFFGHIGVIGADALHTPWFFGPGYPAYDRLDLSNASPLRFARAHGGLNIYVHPVTPADPFPAQGAPNGIPVGLVPDALAGDIDAIELACLWSDEGGTAELWYRLLNLGLPIMPSGGSDTMHNFHRTMAVGATRVYAKPAGPLGMTSFLDAVRQGRSFVTNGPMIAFSADGAEPGAAIAGKRRVSFTLETSSAVPVDSVDVLVNGRVAWSAPAEKGSTVRRYQGEIEVPEGGWLAARVRGAKPGWPFQDSYPYAHTAPIWLGAKGSHDPATARAAAQDLLRWMDVADARLAKAYEGADIPSITARFAEARVKLTALAQ